MPRKSSQNQPAKPQPKPPADIAKILRAWKFQAAGPEYAESGLAILRAAGAVTRQHFLELMLTAESLYPGRGWREAMDDLERFYHDHHLPLKSYPLSRSIGFPLDLPLARESSKNADLPENDED